MVKSHGYWLRPNIKPLALLASWTCIHLFWKRDFSLMQWIPRPLDKSVVFRFIMPQTLKRLRGHFALGLVHLSLSKKYKLGFWNFINRFLIKKMCDPYFWSLNYLPLWSYAPFKMSEWNFVNKIMKISQKLLQQSRLPGKNKKEVILLFSSFCPLQVWTLKTWYKDISKKLTARTSRSFKLCQLIEYND